MKQKTKQLQSFFLVLMMLIMGTAGAWAASVEFVAGKSSGQFAKSSTVTVTPVTLVTNNIGGDPAERQIWKEDERGDG